MASSQGIRAGRAFVELFADDSQLTRGLRAAERRLKAWGAGIRSIGMQVFAGGAAFVAPMLLAVKQFMSAGDALDKMSSRVGASVEFLSALSHAAQIGGTDISAMEVGIRRLQRTAFDAERGLATAKDAFDQLGISVVGADGQLKSTEDLFMESATALSRLSNNTQKAALATVIFGRAGTQLLPMLKDGADGMVAVMEEAKRLGLVMSTQDATSAAELTDAWTRLTGVLKMAVVRIGGALAPSLTELAGRMTSLLKPLLDWIGQNRALIATVFQVAVGIAAAGAGLIALGVLISGVGTAFGLAASVITGVGTVLGVVGTVIGALLSPIGLVTTAVVGLGAYLLYVSGAGSQALGWLADTFQSLKHEAVAAWQGIGDALAAGDLALAAKILWLALRLEWQKGVAFLQQHWSAFKEFFLSIASEAFYGAVGLLIDAWSGLQVAWVETTAFLADAWTVFTSSLTKGWSTAQNFISKGVLRLMKLFDSELDVAAASQILDEDFQRQTAATDRQAQQTIGERDLRRQEERAQIETERQGAQSEIARMADEDRLARERQNSADLSKTGDALAEARKEWESALAEAAQKRAEVAANTPERTRRAQDDLTGMDDLLSQLAEQRISTQGTFNAAAVRGFGGGNAADRTAKATEETAKNTKRLLEQSQHGQLVFT